MSLAISFRRCLECVCVFTNRTARLRNERTSEANDMMRDAAQHQEREGERVSVGVFVVSNQ